MFSFMLFITAIVIAFDAVLLAIYWHPAFILMLAVSVFLIVMFLKIDKSDEITIKEGLMLGEGLDIENPDSPNKIKVILEKASIFLGFLLVGGPGSGKSAACATIKKYFTDILKIAFIYFDGKGDLDVYALDVAANNKADCFFSSELEGTDTVNIVAMPSDDIIEAITQTLITSDNDYYITQQRNAINAVVPLLCSTGKKVNLRDIYVTLKVEDAANDVMNTAQENGAPDEVIEIARQYFDSDEKQRQHDVNGLVTKMSLYVSGKFADRLNDYSPSLDLFEAVKNKKSIYMHLPYTTRSKDIATFFTEQLGVIARNRQLYEKIRTPYALMFDDWGKFFYENIGSITARCRSAKMPCYFLFQSRGQTDAVDPSQVFTTEITDNIGGFIALRINGQSTAKWAAEQFGTYDANELSYNSSNEADMTGIQDKPRVKPEQIKNLNAGEAFIDCLISGEDGASQNKKIKARFPYPKLEKDLDSVEWPVINKPKLLDEDGLNLWDKYMTRNRLVELRNKVISAAGEDDSIDFDLEEFDQDTVI